MCVGCVGRGCYEDSSDLSATSRVCQAYRIFRTTWHKRAALYTAADRRPTNLVSTWQAEQGSCPIRPTRVTSLQGCCACQVCRQRRHQDAMSE